MSHIDAPALLAYKAGDVISTLVDIPRQIPRRGKISSNSIEDLLKQYALDSILSLTGQDANEISQKSDLVKDHSFLDRSP